MDHIKEKILTTVLNILKKYVKNAQVMYIGKAGGTGVSATLQSRIKIIWHVLEI